MLSQMPVLQWQLSCHWVFLFSFPRQLQGVSLSSHFHQSLTPRQRYHLPVPLVEMEGALHKLDNPRKSKSILHQLKKKKKNSMINANWKLRLLTSTDLIDLHYHYSSIHILHQHMDLTLHKWNYLYGSVIRSHSRTKIDADN